MTAGSLSQPGGKRATVRRREPSGGTLLALFNVVDQIAGYGWDVARVPGLLRQLSAVMGDELERISAPAASRRLVNDTVRAE